MSNNMEGDCTRTLLITANVGSIFEEPETMFPGWLSSFFKCLNTHKPGILALHCQEVGGKNYEASMQHVNQFVKTLLSCDELHKYDRARIFLDEDYTAPDKFTALGNLYFIHEDVTDVLIWDFVDCKFVAVEGREVLSGNIENVPIKEKAKFPQHFFPEFKWSRKGFLRTRWSVNNCIYDLINIHLFHDASNIIAMEASPSIYAGNRQRALLHTLQRFENDKYSKVPMFIFGDFNFRLDSHMLIKELTGKLVACPTMGKKDAVNKIEYTEEGNGKIVLTVSIKNFDYYEKHTDLFASMNKWLHQYDSECSSFRDRLFEYDIGFVPSYPFCEDVSDGMSYMKTRVPSWCDRVMLSHAARDILNQEACHVPVYDMIGKDVCMGDHKPVYLFVLMKPGKGNHQAIKCKDSVVESGLHQLPAGTELSSPSDSITSASEFRRPRLLSINGEQVVAANGDGKRRSLKAETNTDIDWSTVNIHDYAKFEQEKYLIPEFRNSIKKLEGDEDASIGNANGNINANDSASQGKSGFARKRSFKELACKVRVMEKVLKSWPRRPRSRHHSSSSEDFYQSESEAGSKGRAGGQKLLDFESGRGSETTSVDTASVDFTLPDSNTEDIVMGKVTLSETNNNQAKWEMKKIIERNTQVMVGEGDGKNNVQGTVDLRTSNIELIVDGEERGIVKSFGPVDPLSNKGVESGVDCTADVSNVLVSHMTDAVSVGKDGVGFDCRGVNVVSPMLEEPGPVLIADKDDKTHIEVKKEQKEASTLQVKVENEESEQYLPTVTDTPPSQQQARCCRCVVQ